VCSELGVPLEDQSRQVRANSSEVLTVLAVRTMVAAVVQRKGADCPDLASRTPCVRHMCPDLVPLCQDIGVKTSGCAMNVPWNSIGDCPTTQ
jgi:hypothetical protein